MTNEHVQHVNESYQRCIGNGDFWGTFYEKFFASSPEVRAKFLHTDFDRQKYIVQRSVGTLIMYINSPESEDVNLEMERLGRLHDHNHIDIPHYMYDLWLKTLFATIGEHDPLFNKTLSAEWAKCLRPVIEKLSGMY